LLQSFVAAPEFATFFMRHLGGHSIPFIPWQVT
jgi:hypothetical protein